MDFTGTTARDNYVGTVDADEFDMSQGGRDTVSGLDGDDVFIFGTEFNANEQIDGGVGRDTLILEGNYLAGVVFGAATLLNVEIIELLAGFNYALTLDEATFTTGMSPHIDGEALGAGDTLFVDASADTNSVLTLIGGAGDDTLIGNAYFTDFFLGQGGADFASAAASAEDATFVMDAAFDAADTLIGGAGVGDNVVLDGDYSAGLTITATMLSGFENISTYAHHNTSLTIGDDVFAAGITGELEVNVGVTPLQVDIVIDGSAETDAELFFFGHLPHETFTGGALGDRFFLSEENGDGGDDVVSGGGGDDLIEFGGHFTRDDQVDGGDGFDTLELDGDFIVDFRAATMAGIELLELRSGAYDLTFGNGNIRGDRFTVDAGGLIFLGDTLVLDASAESSTGIDVLGGLVEGDTVATGAGDDSLTGEGGDDSLTSGNGDDTLDGGDGRDTLTAGLGTDRLAGGGARDVFVYTGFAESTGPGRDWLDVLQPLRDKLDLDVGVAAVAARINTGALSEATFDSDLSAAVASLPAGQAVVFKPDSGDLAGHFFLIVDADGLFGYTAGLDYVFEFAAGSNPNAIATSFFI